MSLSVSNPESYHLEFLRYAARTKYSEATVTLCSGMQRISVQACLLKNASNFLKDLVQSILPCSCTDACIILPHTPSPSLKSFVTLLHFGTVSNISNHVMKGVNLISTALGLENVIEDDVSDCLHSSSDYKNDDKILLVSTSITFNGQNFTLKFPKSRRNRNTLPSTVTLFPLKSFKSRVQEEYNCHPVGQFVGPYDQNERIDLNAQLPNTNLNFASYTEFSHDGKKCFAFKTKKYKSYGDLEKIKSYKVSHELESALCKPDDDNMNIYYTCQHNLCKIPCPCAHCNSDITQCVLHRLHHPDLFDEQLHAVSIRSSELFCKNESFFQNSYVIKFPGIPRDCSDCSRDLLNHESYHFEYHANCRFCATTFFKEEASSKKELDKVIKREAEYYKSVCPYCDKKFCEGYVAKKHIEKEHGEKPFHCEKCDKGFQSFNAKSYHEKTAHSTNLKFHDCNVCGKQFKSTIHLKQHQKYVHSDERKWSCDECDTKFKQKRDLILHEYKKHNMIYSKETYDEKTLEFTEDYNCKECKATFSYKKNLNAHVRNKHGIVEMFKCELCECIFKNRRTLTSHKKAKHEPRVEDFKCPICGKIFADKGGLKRHKKLHIADVDSGV